MILRNTRFIIVFLSETTDTPNNGEQTTRRHLVLALTLRESRNHVLSIISTKNTAKFRLVKET